MLARAIVETVPFWFHRFALNRAGGIFTPGSARDRRSRVSALPEDFAGMSVLDVGCFDGVYAVLAERRGGPRRSWRWTTSSTGCGSLPAGALSWRAGRASEPFIDCSARRLSIDRWTRSRSTGSRNASTSCAASACCTGVENSLGLLRVLRGRTVDGGTVLVETYGVGPEDRNGPAIRVSEPGEVYARDEFVYWGFGDAGLQRIARIPGLSRRVPSMWRSTATRALSVGWSRRSSRTALSTASSQNNNQWSLLPLWVRGVERVQLCANPGPVRLAVWRRAPAELLVGRVAASGFLNLPRLRKLGQASGDASSIEV